MTFHPYLIIGGLGLLAFLILGLALLVWHLKDAAEVGQEFDEDLNDEA